jgi:hypothetical protein
VGEVVELAGAQRALDDLGVGRTGVERAGHVEEPLAGQRLELAPELVGAAQERHVRGVLVVGQADDAGDAV